MLINYGRKFSKQYNKADPHHRLLNNHSLTGEYVGYRSINITGNWRAVFSEIQDEEGNELIVFKVLGTHSQLYK